MAKKKKRATLDQYPTPEWVVHRLFEHPRFPVPKGGTWFEPCVGDGAIVRAVPKGEVRRWVVNDIDLHRLAFDPGGRKVAAGDRYHLDILEWDRHGSIDELKRRLNLRLSVVITNPPYCIAQEVVERCRPLAPWLVLLLRTQFLASEERADFFRRDEPDIFLLPNRPSFTGDGDTDMHDYAWFVWGPKRRRMGRLHHLASTSKAVRRPRPATP